jgi:tripartite-type tricarboxylate transporter receptor subunit TctC
MLDRRRFLAAGAAFAAGSTTSFAQTFPNRPITLVVPFTAGGGTDIGARQLGQSLSSVIGQPVIIDNRPGGNGIVAGQAVQRAAPDGHTILIATAASFSAAPAFGQKLPYDVAKDFRPVAMLGLFPLVLNANVDLPVRDLKEFIAYCRARPGKLNYASAGVGGTNHIVFELISQAAGLHAVHVPYRGAAPAATDLIAGHVQVFVDSLAASFTHIQDGRVRALAVTTANRQPQVPNVPTLKEQGVDVVYPGWASLMVASATPAPIVARLSAAVIKALGDEVLVKRYREQVIEPVTWNVEETGAFMDKDRAMLVELSRKTGIKMD